MNLNRIIAAGFRKTTNNHCKVYLPRTKPNNDDFDYNPLNVCIV